METESVIHNKNQGELQQIVEGRSLPTEIVTQAQGSSSRLGSETPPNENSQLLNTSMRMNLSKVRAAFANRNALVDVLAVFFGVGTWIGINSTYVQLPLLVNATPEGWNLASYIVIIIQIGNIGPLLYTLLQKIAPIKDSFIIYFLLAIGIIAGFCMAFLYPITAEILGAERSLAIFVNVFLFALVGCTSSVLFMPYFGRFRDIYLVTYLIGEGLSGFLPGVLALIQGVGGNDQCIKTDTGIERFSPPPRFGTQTFFLVVSSLFIASFVSFFLLDQLKIVRNEYAESVTIGHGNTYEYNVKQPKAGDDEVPTKPEGKQLSDKNYRGLLVLLGVVCMFSNAIFPSIMSFGTLPYGNIAYHLAVTLSSIANPVACFIAVFVTNTSIRNIIALCVITIPFATYSMTTAVMSPNPPLMNKVMGEILVVISWTAVVGLASYIRLKITTIFRYQGGRSLVLVGAWTQIGSFVGAILSFIVVNFTNVFQTYDPCA
ncbi:CLUMA_CG005291, isoform A [Clunio marinus]|uniref:Riboflavin transporter n=1 Tax=Clunio marinus TaxID=568069 RepID=A0A1J1HU90_9DIPT|nr:CLUMA_CG005291, isoform A [Clunio marinus]